MILEPARRSADSDIPAELPDISETGTQATIIHLFVLFNFCRFDRDAGAMHGRASDRIVRFRCIEKMSAIITIAQVYGIRLR